MERLGEEVPCLPQGRTEREHREDRHCPRYFGRLVAGDEVVIERLADGTYAVRGVHPRRNEVVWPVARGAGRVRAANLDRLVVVEAVSQPGFSRLALNRQVARHRRATGRPLVVLNKCDLFDGDDIRRWVAPLAEEGLEVLLTSAVDGRGVDRLRSGLAGRVSAIVGRSGVGKTRLVREMFPGYDFPETWVPAGRGGRPVSSRLHPVPGGGYLAL